MLIVGAKGFAKEVLEVLLQMNEIENIYFYDDVNDDIKGKLYNKFTILKTKNEVIEVFKNIDNRFSIGIGNPVLRKILYEKFKKLGGIYTSVISPYSNIGHFGNQINEGVNIMTGTIITNDISIGKGSLINLNCTIGHDTIIGDFVEMSPGTHISGNCHIGNKCVFGTNSTVLPGVKIGNNSIIGAGAVVTKDLPHNCLAIGIPAKVIKQF